MVGSAPGVRGARGGHRRGLASIMMACSIVSLDCKHLTAEPGKPVAASVRPTTFTAAETLYDGGLKPGWQDWGWGTHDLSLGPARLNMSAYGGWILHHDPISTRFGAVAFRMRTALAGSSFLEIRLANGNGDQSFPPVDVGPELTRPVKDGWLEIYVPWLKLNPSGSPFDRITIRAKTSIPAEPISFDKLVFTQFDAAAQKAAELSVPVKSLTLTVECKAPDHAISPYIYGVAGDVGDLGATTVRWGGNRTTRYNWQINATNVGKDWYYENVKADDYRQFLDGSRKGNVAAALTIPIIGWVAKDASSSGFPISVYGPQRARDPYRSDAGDGNRADGALIKPNSPSLTSVEATPAMIQRWVEAIAQRDQRDQSRSVQQYILDNEPSLWSANHRDVHPEPVTYDELLERTIRYGTAIRAADPHAVIAGPAEWGWMGYFYSARDLVSGVTLRPDRRAHGDVPLLPWYLSKLREHDQASGGRLLDVVDVHFYPQGQGVYSPNSDAATAALRIRSTRALWDPTYKDESWINDTVQLIPRLKDWVAKNYPGLGISIGEYNFGGESHISGALALAEALGRFGSQGIDYAYYWNAPPKNSPAYWAFRAYRNFDGKNAHFQERSLVTRMDADVSLFASRDATGKHVVLIALNLNPTTAAKSKIDMNGCSALATGQKFRYDGQSAGLVGEALKISGPLTETLPPYSITVFDLTLK